MFGFPLLRSLNTIPVEAVTFESLINSYFGEKEVDLEGAKTLDVYHYTVNSIQYEQKVYRLKNGSVYVATTSNTDETKNIFEEELKKAVAEQRFEYAASLRDKLKRLK